MSVFGLIAVVKCFTAFVLLSVLGKELRALSAVQNQLLKTPKLFRLTWKYETDEGFMRSEFISGFRANGIAFNFAYIGLKSTGDHCCSEIVLQIVIVSLSIFTLLNNRLYQCCLHNHHYVELPYSHFFWTGWLLTMSLLWLLGNDSASNTQSYDTSLSLLAAC